jgi:cytoskeleton protein RodZ
MDMNEQRKAAASGAGDGSSDPAMTGQDMTAGADAAVAGDSPPAAAGAAEEAAATVASAPALISPGALLARAREQYGLSVGEIASQMKLAPRQVEALEADAWDRLPSMLFVRGFIKGYARCVHADPAPALAALEVRCGTAASQERASTEQAIARAAQPSTAIPFPSSDQPSRRLHRIAAALAVLCIGFLAFEWFGPTLQSVQGVVESDRARAVAAPGAVAQPESAPQGAAEGALLPAVPAPQPAGTAPGATARATCGSRRERSGIGARRAHDPARLRPRVVGRDPRCARQADLLAAQSSGYLAGGAGRATVVAGGRQCGQRPSCLQRPRDRPEAVQQSRRCGQVHARVTGAAVLR